MGYTAKNHIRPRKLSDAVARHLESLILEGTLRSGERLPPERELALQLDVSRPSLREALATLEQRGILETRRGGTFVGPILGAAFASDLQELMRSSPDSPGDYLEFRSGMDGVAAAFAAERASDIDLDIIGQRFRAIEDMHQREQPDAEADADALFHLATYEASHNVLMIQIMGGLADLLRQDVLYNRFKLYSRQGVRELLLYQHRAIHDAIQARDPQAARAAAETHVSFTRAALSEIDRTDTRLELALRRFAESEGAP